MASVQAFTTVMDEFLTEFKEVFPDEKKIKVYYNSFVTLKKTNGRKVLDLFMSKASTLGDKITKRDESIFDEDDMFPDLNLSELWKTTDNDTKDAIWQYLNTLYVLGSTISALPSELIQTIESVAEQCASSIDTEKGEMPDMSNLLSGMQNMMKNFNLPNMEQNKPKELKSKKSKKTKTKM